MISRYRSSRGTFVSLCWGVGFLLVLAGCAGGSDTVAVEPATEGTAATSTDVPPAAPTSSPDPTPPPVESAETPEEVEGAETPEEVEGAETDEIAVVAEREPVVYDGDFGTSIAPIFAQKCASCHNAGGPGATHWQLETAADVVATHEWVAGLIDTGYMPPWPASDLSPLFHDDRSLAPDEIQAVLAWSDDGAPLDVDVATSIEAPAPAVALDADAIIEPHESYQGSTAVADDYRCFIYELGVTEPTWMQGYEFVPDQTQIVHHAVGVLAPASNLAQAQRQSARDDIGGWQCFGSPGLVDDRPFVGWAPGQLPTVYPEGSGILVQPGDFAVLQIHYHVDVDAPEDRSTLHIDWADETNADGLDPIEFDTFLAPAEIPCSSDEAGPLCDRDAARARALGLYGRLGVQADAINSVCGVRPADFESMTDGIASSSCTIPVRVPGQIVSVFGHQHEIGKSIRMTLNAGQPDEKLLLDIPDWSFDWQLNYELVDPIPVDRGDTILLECTWDRDRRDPDLEPAWILWADGTNDEMCFASMTTRAAGDVSAERDDAATDELLSALQLPAEIGDCRLGFFSTDGQQGLTREMIEFVVEELFTCATPEEIGDALAGLLADNFAGLVPQESTDCLAGRMATPEGARDLLTFSLPDATTDESRPVATMVGDCVPLSDVIIAFGFPIPDDARACVDEAGVLVLVQATLARELPDELFIFSIISQCIGE